MKPYNVLFITCFLFACSQKKRINSIPVAPRLEPTLVVPNLSSELTLKNDSLFFRNKKMSGVLYSLSTKSNDTVSIKSYVNGVLDGISKGWYSNGQLMETRSYKNGQKNGSQIAYFENGQMKFEFIAENDRYEGELREWNSDGRLIHLATFENGQEAGAQKMWYDNGKVRANYVIIKGKRYGLLGTKNCRNVSDSIFTVN